MFLIKHYILGIYSFMKKLCNTSHIKNTGLHKAYVVGSCGFNW